MVATSSCQAAAKASRSASRHCVCARAVTAIAVRSIGRTRRTRRSTSPSSSIRLGAGICTAARPDWALTSRLARGSFAAPSASSSVKRLVAVAPGDGEHLCLGPGRRMDIDGAPLGDVEALRRQRLDAEIVGAGGDGAFDLRGQQVLEHREERVLQVDGKREQAVEKVEIGGSSSRRPPSPSVSAEPVASSKACSEQPSTLPL